MSTRTVKLFAVKSGLAFLDSCFNHCSSFKIPDWIKRLWKVFISTFHFPFLLGHLRSSYKFDIYMKIYIWIHVRLHQTLCAPSEMPFLWRHPVVILKQCHFFFYWFLFPCFHIFSSFVMCHIWIHRAVHVATWMAQLDLLPLRARR